METSFYKYLGVGCFGLFLGLHNPVPAQTDQQLIYSTYFGGADIDELRSVVHTPDLGLLAVGDSYSSGIATDSVHQNLFAGGYMDGIILKLNAERQREWVSYYGGEGDDVINDIKVLPDGTFVVVGATNSVNGIGTSNAFMPVSPGGSSAFVAKFSATGERQWGTYFGGTGEDIPWNEATAVAISTDGSLIFVGKTAAIDFPVTNDAHQTSFGGVSDGTLTKFSPNGELIWSTYFGGSGEERIHDVLFSENGDIVVLGYTESATGIATTSSHQENYGGEGDAFLARFTDEGELVWSTYYGGNKKETAGGVAVQSLAMDHDNNFYLRLESRSETGMTTTNAPIEALEFDESVVLAKFSGDGEFLWGTYFGENVLTNGGAITVSDEQIIVGGVARSATGYLMGNPYQSDYYGTSSTGDIFLAGFSTSDGQQQWGTYFGSVSSESSWSFAPVVDHRLTLVGYTHSYGMSTPDAFQPIHGGGYSDGLLSVFDLSNVTGVGEKPALQLGVYPNPARGFVRVQLPPSFSFGAEVTVFNLAGQVVAVHPHFNALEPLALPQTPGMYVLECRNGNEVVRAKVVVE